MEHINALPEPARRYVHDLETRADSACDVATLAIQRDTIAALERLLEEARRSRFGVGSPIEPIVRKR